MSRETTLRSVFISDLHIGYKGADIRSLNAFLRAYRFNYLYLVGDILDGWKLEKRWYWNQDYSDFLDILVELKSRGVQIVMISGNHDEKLRQTKARLSRAVLFRRFGIWLNEQVIHNTQDGRRLLIIHGDQLDGPLFRSTSKYADGIWLRVDNLTWSRAKAERPMAEEKRVRWSLGKAIATHAKSLIASYADAALRMASRNGADGIICGHSHIPSLINRGSLVFGNCGSWTGARVAGEYHTALVEQCDGRLELVKWPSMRGSIEDQRYRNLDLEDLTTQTKDAAKLARLIHRFWAPASVDPSVAARSYWPSRSSNSAAPR
ncbi:MAG: UDP-2,3-diacylglucosamine diphosphatase [Pseudomonadota bacterium]